MKIGFDKHFFIGYNIGMKEYKKIKRRILRECKDLQRGKEDSQVFNQYIDVLKDTIATIRSLIKPPIKAKPIHKEYPRYWILPTGEIWYEDLNRYISPFLDKTGHVVVGLVACDNPNGSYARTFYEYVGNLVLCVFDKPCPEGMTCIYLDGDLQNTDRDNLCWGTV